MYLILGGVKLFVCLLIFECDIVMFVIEVVLIDCFNMIFDVLYVDFLDEKILCGIEVLFVWG